MVAFLIGCAVLLIVVGCSGTRSEGPREQGQTEVTEQEQGHSAEATASEENRCGGTRSLEGHAVAAQRKPREPYLTNDVPGCPNGGILSGTDGPDRLYGGDGGDEVRGLGDTDEVYGGLGKDVIYGGDGSDFIDVGGSGEANIYCGEGKDFYVANEDDYVSSSCEEEAEVTVTY